MREKDLIPEHLRCKRTDGRQWRCKRRAMDGKTLCDIHYLQGKHRQNKQKVPESLKLERTVTKKRDKKSNRDNKNNNNSGASTSRITKLPLERKRQRCVSEKLDEALKRMKLRRGDLQLELIRVFLKRQVEKKREREMRENAVGDETRQLPYGRMAIEQAPLGFREGDVLDVKLGVDSCGYSAALFSQRDFRSKNIEPMPIGTMQVVPFADNVKKKKMKRCHWCRETKCRCLIKCLTCRKRFFCLECIKKRYFEKQNVKAKCPACRGTCNCMICMKQQYRANNRKECYKGERKLRRIELLHYLIHKLLPVLKKLNLDQSIELETEANATGNKQSEIQIPQAKLAFHTSPSCSKCKTSIVDYHWTCTNCSYILCLSCCQEFSRQGLNERFKLKNCKKRKIHSSNEELEFKPNISRQSSVRLPFVSLKKRKTSEDGSIPCPSTDVGGCGGSVLDLRCMFPFNWTKDLEVRAEEILCSYHLPETADVSSCCSLCEDTVNKNGEVKPQRELPRRIGFDGNYLYCPTVKDLHQETLEHFQNHWGKGEPVIVRNVLCNTTSFWDPVTMFCSYMEKKISESCNENGMKATDCLDWFEVEFDKKRIFLGSLEKRTYASMHQKVLKFKAWLSSHLFQKQFPIHYNEIISALPLPEYVNPVSGLLNVGLRLPKEFQKPDLGPCIHFSYGGPGELTQADYLSKLCYESHDMVNILAYATNAPISSEQICKIENLMKKYRSGNRTNGQSFSNSSDQKGKSSLQSDATGESSLQDLEEKVQQLPDGIEKVPFVPSDPLKSRAVGVENGDLSDDSESDDEASVLYCGSEDESENSCEYFQAEDIESASSTEDKGGTDSCGAQWDIFSREDVPKLKQYLEKYSDELSPACSYSKHVHPILDQNFVFDAYHKLRLKQEFDVQPWTFEQCPGEAVFIPAGCPYQIRKIKSCVSVVLDFISPENAARCIQLNDEIRLLPMHHKARTKVMEVEKMALHGISTAIEDICNLIPVKQVP